MNAAKRKNTFIKTKSTEIKNAEETEDSHLLKRNQLK